MSLLFRVSGQSVGAEKRLYKAIRLWLMYMHMAKHQGWTKKYKARMRDAQGSMALHLKKVIRNNWPGYTRWEVEILGSNRFLDLQKDRHLRFLVILEGKPED